MSSSKENSKRIPLSPVSPKRRSSQRFAEIVAEIDEECAQLTIIRVLLDVIIRQQEEGVEGMEEKGHEPHARPLFRQRGGGPW